MIGLTSGFVRGSSGLYCSDKNKRVLQLGAQVPRYGLVTTANCKQLMLFLEDRHGEAAVDDQDLDLTLLRTAQVNAQAQHLHDLAVSLQRMSACDPRFSIFRSLNQRSCLCTTASALHHPQQTCQCVLLHKSASAYVFNMFRCWMCITEHNIGAAGVCVHSSRPSATSDWPCTNRPPLRSSEKTACDPV